MKKFKNTLPKKIEDSILDFLKDFESFFRDTNLRNQWFIYPYFKLYMRKSYRYINSQSYYFIDIANIGVEPQYQNKGVCTCLLKTILSKYSQENFFIESVINPLIEPIIIKQGFEKQHVTEYSEVGQNYYKIACKSSSN